jgi:peptide/nickel transport system ATP-binding protein
VTEPVLLSIRDLAIDFRLDGSRLHPAVKGISFDVPERGSVALVGESGSGKSATALAVLGLLPQENALVGPKGRIEFEGRDLLAMEGRDLRAVRGRAISMVFQEPMNSLNPVFSVGFQLGEVLRRLGLNARQARARAIELLQEVGIPEPARRVDAYPFELSGGQQQRVMIAMAIACEPKLLIADEPTTGLDVTVQKQILDLIAGIRERRKMAMLFITHDLSLVAEIADQVVVMRHGEIREQGELTQVFESPRDAYTKALLACRPPLAGRPGRLPVIEDFMGDSATGQVLAPERTRGLRGDESTVLEVRRLGKDFEYREGLFRKRAFKAFGDATFKLARGKTLGIVGESGSGKTTLALTLVGIHAPTDGEVLFDGRNLIGLSARDAHAYRRRIQIVFQNPYASLNPRFTVGRLLAEPMEIHAIGADAGARRGLAREMLRRVGLAEDSLERYPHEFSGGQRQRIAIARCLVLRPEVLILDEAVSALDVSVQAQLLNLLQELQDEFGLSYIFISHDLAVVRYISDQVMVMNAGEIVECADADEVYANPKHPYTKRLLSSMPQGWRRGP